MICIRSRRALRKGFEKFTEAAILKGLLGMRLYFGLKLQFVVKSAIRIVSTQYSRSYNNYVNVYFWQRENRP